MRETTSHAGRLRNRDTILAAFQDLIRKLPLDPKEKRILLAVVAFRFPEQAKGLRELALALDFHRDPLSLCLRKCLE